jgi:hypothetical protein
LRFTGRVCLVWLLAGLVPVLHAEDAKSSPPAPNADEEFLEFLGSIDTDEGDEEWMDYLARTDIAKVAKAKKSAPAVTEAEATDKAGK